MGGIPAWALATGAFLEAPKAASNWLGLWKGINEIRNEGNTADAYKNLYAFRTPQEVDAYDPTQEGRFSAEGRESVEKKRAEILKGMYEKDAAPLQDIVSNAIAKGGYDASSDPRELILAEAKKAGITVNMNNPTARGLLTQFSTDFYNRTKLAENNRRMAAGEAYDPSQFADLQLGNEKLESMVDAANKQLEQRGVANYAEAQGMAGRLLLPSKRTGQYDSSEQVRADLGDLLSQFQLKPEQVKTIQDNIDKGMSDVFVNGRNPYTGAISPEVAAQLQAERDATRDDRRDTRQARSLAAIADRMSRRGENPLQQSTFVDPASGKPLVYDKRSGTYKIATVEGGGVAPKPSPVSPEAAAKAQLVEQAQGYMPQIKEMYLTRSGGVNRTAVNNSAVRTPFTKGRQASSLILDAMEAKLRAESGAAVPEPEVRRMAKRYMPSPLDDDATIKMKLDNLDSYLKGTVTKVNRGKGVAQTESRSSSYSDLLNRHRIKK